jgi:hypothetical protein
MKLIIALLTLAFAATSSRAAAVTEPAPEGVFYLITTVKVETDAGVVGLKPGTGVKLVRPGIYLTPAGEQPLKPEQLTNDLVIARAARDADAAAHAAIQAMVATLGEQQKAAAAKAAEAAEDTQVTVQEGMDKQKAIALVATLEQQETALEAQTAALRKKLSKEGSNAAAGRTVSSTTDTQFAAAQASSRLPRKPRGSRSRSVRSTPKCSLSKHAILSAPPSPWRHLYFYCFASTW